MKALFDKLDPRVWLARLWWKIVKGDGHDDGKATGGD